MTQNNAEKGKKQVSRREFLLGSGAVIAAIVLASCSKAAPSTSGTSSSTTSSTTPSNTTGPSSTPSTPKYGGTLKQISTSVGISNIGWPFDGFGILELNQSCLEILLRADYQGNLYGWLAESFKVADDFKSITFNLQRGIKFHDGSDFNAEVTKWNLDNYINAKMAPYWSSVDMINDYTVRVNFTQWKNDLPYLFAASAAPMLAIVSKAAFDKYGESYMRQHQIGTGPFKFDSYTNSVSLKYVRNPNYWGKDAQGNQYPYLDGMETIYVADPTTMKLLAQSGQGDMLNANPGKDARDYAGLGFKIKTQINTNNVLVPDSAHTDSPWSNQQVREAVEYAIDREAISKAFGFGYWQAPYQIPPRDCAAYNPDFTLAHKYDKAKAKQLLTQAGYPSGFKTTIIVAPIGTEKNVATALQGNLADVGIQADLQYPEMATWLANYMGAGGGWHNAGMLMGCPMNDPTFTEALRFIDQMWGSSWLKTSEVKQAFQTAMDSPTMDFKLARAATDILTEQALVIPIYEGGTGTAYRPYVIPDFTQRSFGPEKNCEDYWLNK